MHQTILLRAHKNLEIAKGLELRLIRSSSASLPPAVFNDLNDVFSCPVIEAYGMTEATHQMTSNPLPPKQQKAGFVGLPAGPEVCIMNENGEVLKQGDVGEVCIKGENVTLGYDNNEEANKTSFTNGWFRTGDQGYFCLLYTSDAADEKVRVDLGGRRIIKKNFFQAEDGIRD